MNAGLFETIFWICFGAIMLWITGTAIWMMVQWSAPTGPAPRRKAPAGKDARGADEATYSLMSATSDSPGTVDLSFASSAGSNAGGDFGTDSSGGGDSGGGDFSGGGGESGGGGSSGGW